MTDITARIQADDIITGDDGFAVYWPERWVHGAFSAHDLRAIADELDRRNAPWAAEVEAYFDQQKTPPTNEG